MIQILFFQLIIKPLLAFFIGVRVMGKSNLPHRHPFILVANHTSHLDTIILLNLFPLKELKYIRPVAAADYFNRNPILYKASSWLFNILLVERKQISRNQHPLVSIKLTLQKNESLIFFPEGTRGNSEDIAPFHSGIAHLTDDFPQVPIVPIYLSNTYRALPKGEIFLVPFICNVHIGAPIILSGHKEQKLAYLRSEMEKLQINSKWDIIS